MQSGELYDSGVAKHTLFAVTGMRKGMKGDFFRMRAAGYSVFRHEPGSGTCVRCGSTDRRIL